MPPGGRVLKTQDGTIKNLVYVHLNMSSGINDFFSLYPANAVPLHSYHYKI